MFMFSTVGVASLCRSVGRRSKRWSRVGVGNGKRTWRRRGLSWRAASWTPIAGVGAQRSRPAGCRWEAGFMPPAGGQLCVSGSPQEPLPTISKPFRIPVFSPYSREGERETESFLKSPGPCANFCSWRRRAPDPA
jgi:hypothetical protein